MIRFCKVICIVFIATGLKAQSVDNSDSTTAFADRSYYLIDSLNLNELTVNDRSLLDSALTLYHVAAHDTDRLNALGILCENMMDESWESYQKIQYAALEQLVAEPTSDKLLKLYNLRLAGATNNMGYIHLMRGSNSKATEYYEKAKVIAEKLNDTKSKATYYISMGYLHRSQGNTSKAIEYYRRSLKLSGEIGDKKALAVTMNNIGQIYHNTGDVKRGLEYYHKSLKLHDELGESSSAALTLNNIGSIHHGQCDFEEALASFQECFRIQKHLGDKLGMSLALNNMGAIYETKGDKVKALEYFNMSLTLREEIGDKNGTAATLNNIGLLYKSSDEFEKALKFSKRGLKLYEGLGDRAGMSWTLGIIGTINLESGNLEDARIYADKAMGLANDIGYPGDIRDAAKLLSKVHKLHGDHEQALWMYELFIKMRDSINNEETNKAAIRQQTQYEFEKEQIIAEKVRNEEIRIENEELKRRDNLQYSVVLISLLVLGAGLIALGRFPVPIRIAEGLIFFSFLIFFEFILVLADPSIENWSGGAPGIKLLFNAGIAAMIFPLHSFFETKLKGRLRT